MTDTDTQPNTRPGSQPGPQPRDRILEHALRAAPFEGWTDATVRKAARAAGLPPGADELYAPGGALDLLGHWHDRTVEHVEAEIARRGGLANLPVRARVTEGVLIAMEATSGHETAMRRALARLALPDAGGQGPRQLWEMADAIWHGIGDTSTDFNHYTKRAILSGVISSTLAAWLADTSPDKADARAFLDRRIENVMGFETVKRRVAAVTDRLPNPAKLLGTLRYGRAGLGKGVGMGSMGSGNAPDMGAFTGMFGGAFARPSTRRRRRRGL